MGVSIYVIGKKEICKKKEIQLYDIKWHMKYDIKLYDIKNDIKLYDKNGR